MVLSSLPLQLMVNSHQLMVSIFDKERGDWMAVEIRQDGPLGYYFVNYCFFNYVEEKVEEKVEEEERS